MSQWYCPSKLFLTNIQTGKMSGRAVQIVQSKDNCITLDIPALEEILLDEKVRGKKVVLISVAGAYRKGKSFFLCFLLRYLKAKGSLEWMGSPDEPLEGFIWKNSIDGITNGILMWSEVFIITMPNHEEVAVILLDTEGTFAYNSTMKNCATIFALSTQISSVQVYNLSQNIQATDLHHLQLFTEYGKLGLNKSTQQTSLQDLLFLIRNWENPASEEYGIYGGENYLNQVLVTEENQNPELKGIRQHLRSSFRHISCFLMPHPGKTVATGAHFNGRLSDIDDEFIQHLAALVPMLLSPEKLVIKEVNGKQITAEELVKYFKAYMTKFQGENLPPIKSLYEATAEVNNQIAVDDAKKYYKTYMDEICSGKPSMSSTELKDKHLLYKGIAITQFQDTNKMGERQFSEKYETQLSTELDEMYVLYKKSNKEKIKHEKVMKELEELKRKRQKEDLQRAVNAAKAHYKTLMDGICCSGNPSMSSPVLEYKHLERKQAAIMLFQNTGETMEGQLSCEYEQKLITELDKKYEDYKKSNDKKRRQEEKERQLVMKKQQFRLLIGTIVGSVVLAAGGAVLGPAVLLLVPEAAAAAGSTIGAAATGGTIGATVGAAVGRATTALYNKFWRKRT